MAVVARPLCTCRNVARLPKWPFWEKEFGNVGKKYRGIAGTPGVDGRTHVGTDEERAQAKVPCPALVSERGGAHREGLEDLYVAYFVPTSDQSLDERRRRRTHSMQIHAVSRFDGLHGCTCIAP